MKLLVLSCLSGAAALNFAVLALLLGARSGRAGTGARFENGTWCAEGILERAKGGVGCCPKSCGVCGGSGRLGGCPLPECCPASFRRACAGPGDVKCLAPPDAACSRHSQCPAGSYCAASRACEPCAHCGLCADAVDGDCHAACPGRAPSPGAVCDGVLKCARARRPHTLNSKSRVLFYGPAATRDKRPPGVGWEKYDVVVVTNGELALLGAEELCATSHEVWFMANGYFSRTHGHLIFARAAGLGRLLYKGAFSQQDVQRLRRQIRGGVQDFYYLRRKIPGAPAGNPLELTYFLTFFFSSKHYYGKVHIVGCNFYDKGAGYSDPEYALLDMAHGHNVVANREWTRQFIQKSEGRVTMDYTFPPARRTVPTKTAKKPAARPRSQTTPRRKPPPPPKRNP